MMISAMLNDTLKKNFNEIYVLWHFQSCETLGSWFCMESHVKISSNFNV